ncbi:MAG: class I SAM-dependent RNA methyltransferase [Nocardioidaceae bacterium]|nr:class I SAM-dependent RNA methyltransferase [Nocardioidaceae bacterium]
MTSADTGTTDGQLESPSLIGQELPLDIGAVAHGGHCVARHEGRVIFVRHAIPGERVLARITEGEADSRFLRADAVEVLSRSPDRVQRPCPYAGPELCGGCDFQHVSLPRQRSLLADVVREQLERLAGIDWPVRVEPVPGDVDGLRWRTRVGFVAAANGKPGLRRHRSHDVIPVADCLIGHTELPDVTSALDAGAASAQAVVSGTGERVVVTDPKAAPVVTEQAAGRTWQLHASDFWQVHPGAADALVAAVIDGLQPAAGERCWDLYAGVGLFAGALAERIGLGGAVVAVESHRRAAESARRNLADLSQVRVVTERVDRFARSRIAQGRLDLVVLDPPRAGAGAAAIRGITKRRPRAIAYVACDPAALARDLATLSEGGYELVSLRAFDIFPMTAHVECVAICERRPSASERNT